MIEHYCIARSTPTIPLEAVVNQKIKEGYIPIGGITQGEEDGRLSWYQSMVKLENSAAAIDWFKAMQAMS